MYLIALIHSITAWWHIQEGILIKEVTSPYLVASRSKHWFKLKSDSECHVLVASLFLPSGFGQCAKASGMTLIWCPHAASLVLFTFCKITLNES